MSRPASKSIVAIRKGKGATKEETERMQHEAEERARYEALLKLEHEAEERQRIENQLRDEAETKERKRAKKEAQLKLLAEKDESIIALSTQLKTLESRFAAETSEMKEQLMRAQELKDTVLNELSCIRSEHDELRQQSSSTEAALRDQISRLSEDLSRTKEERDAIRKVKEETEATLGSRLGNLGKEHEQLLQMKIQSDKDLRAQVAALERELEKTTTLSRTLQEVLDSRESEDRKNLTLMTMLQSQLDDNKRRAHELLEQERAQTNKTQQQLVMAEARIATLTEENEQHVKDKESLKRSVEAGVGEYKAKLEQMRFDIKYLNSELYTYKSQLSKVQQDTVTIKTEAVKETSKAKLDLEGALKRVEELESLLRRKEREHYDKTTFLNAQIANNRTIISQQQQKMQKEREDHQREHKQLLEDAESNTARIQTLMGELDARKLSSGEIEMKLSADVAILKTTVFQLQSALHEKEREVDSIRVVKDDEIKKLRRKLDDNFIPHRSEIETTADMDERSVEQVLNEKLEKLTRELEVRNRVALEAETRLKAQISNQNHMIDSLQAELQRCKDDLSLQIRHLEDESARLKHLLDINYIPYRK